jgi:MoaA/NifB/PqqE/SkfB family radical SAM enzyme
MSITLQITRICNLECVYCSEDAQLKQYPLSIVKKMIDNMSGVNRIIVSGGEPTLRRDLVDILKYLHESAFPTIAIATNATRITPDLARQMKPYLSYADVTIDGSPEVHNQIRGQFDKVLSGIRNLKAEGVDVSLVNVLLGENRKDIIDVCQMAQDLGARKLKILSPIKKGRGAEVLSHGMSSNELINVFELVKAVKKERNWTLKITITDWDLVSEGHAVLIHPDGDIVASPVPSQSGCVLKFGNILEGHIAEAWRHYPFIENHVKKYFEESLLVC